MRRYVVILALSAALAACERVKPNVVVVLPEADGHVGAVVVRPAAGESTVLDRAFAAVHADRGGKPAPVAMDRKAVDEIFAPALAARPQPPKAFTLYFQEGRDELTASSRAEFEEVFTEIARRPVAEIVAIGHTDRVGSLADNDKLALRRAEAMRELLTRRGIVPSMITAAGRGEREPLIATPDEVGEPRNRRVEVLVR